LDLKVPRRPYGRRTRAHARPRRPLFCPVSSAVLCRRHPADRSIALSRLPHDVSTCYVRRATFGVLRSTCYVRRAAFDVLRSTCYVRRATFDVLRSTFNVIRSLLDARRAAFDVQRARFAARRSTCCVPRSTRCVRHATAASCVFRSQEHPASTAERPMLPERRLPWFLTPPLFPDTRQPSSRCFPRLHPRCRSGPPLPHPRRGLLDTPRVCDS